MRRLFALAVAFTISALVACGDGLTPAARPVAPGANDPAYTVQGVKDWYLIGDGATKGDDLMTISVVAPSGTDAIDAWVGSDEHVRLMRQGDGSFGVQISIAEVPSGTHDLLLATNGASTAFAKMTFKRSAPYYVLVTTDWDFSDPGDVANGYQDTLHVAHPQLRMTHFVGPYTFTDPKVDAGRRQALVAWLVRQRETSRDEVGLHIHPYCHFVESAGVTCIVDQSTVYAQDPTGYTIKLAAYDRQKMGMLLDQANALFVQNGLNRPRTFRAGGWTANLDTLAALSDKGFTADTSALNWARIEEWKGLYNGELYRWNMQNWGPISDTSQPYRPNQNDVLSSAAPHLGLLEVPDDGVMIDYVTLEEMTGLFDANWNGEPLASPTTLMMGFHPTTSFAETEYRRIDGFLDYADRRLAAAGRGPVVYITLEDIVAAYAP